MSPDDVRSLLARVKSGRVSVEGAMKELRALPFRDLEHARVDTHRHLRCGFPEVILCQGKAPEEVARIAVELLGHGDRLLATRATPEIARAVRERVSEAVYDERARTITARRGGGPAPRGLVAVVCAGTADIPVAEEARVTAELMDARVETFYDVGIAGIHRLLGEVPRLQEANALVVVAGMEGALASVVGGLVARPVVAVPTSVGYGASFGGIAPLLTMLNSCAAGVSVVNIDNGFGGGYLAGLINAVAVGADGRGRSRS
ncbi:MAG TPA: nickel pincer cofactor biosynthesis protein LarB [Planctomycetota bacterium]|nr:nickel pincer cofactor biosynthesis protein LarB [Planctomycetota bacterium]